MASIANLLVSLKADFGDSDAKFDSFIKKMGDVDDKEKETEENLRHLKHGAEEGGEGLESLKEILGELAEELVKFTAEAFALTSVFEALKEAVEVTAELQSAAVAMDTFTGSAEKTSEVMEHLEELANSEALSFKEVVPAAQHMMALGFSAEDMEKALRAAGNAAWALGTPVESVSQRMAQMALSGMANARMLRTLGISSEDLAHIMGVSIGEVTKTFKVLDQETRLDVLTEAMSKFGDQGAKQAETLKGRWIELKNAFHESFATMGDDLEPFAETLENVGIKVAHVFTELVEDVKALAEGFQTYFPLITHLAETAGMVLSETFALVSDSLSNDKNIDALKIWGDSIKRGIPYSQASKEAHDRLRPIAGVLPEGETGPLGAAKTRESVASARGPLEAKEAAGIELARIAAQEEAVKQSAALARERAEAEINANHTIIQSIIEKDKDVVTRAQATAQEEIRVAKEKAARIGAINAGETKTLEDLLNKQRAPKIAQTFQPEGDESKRAAQIAEINIKTDSEIAKSRADLAAKQEKLQDAVVQASAKGNAQILKESEKVITQMENEWYGFFNKISKAGDETTKAFEKMTQEQIASQDKISTIGDRGTLEDKVLKLKQQEIALEGEYSRQLAHTDAEHLTYLQKIDALEAAQRQARLADLASQLHDLGPRSQDTTVTAEKRAQLEAQIQQLSLENQNAQLQAANAYLQVVQQQNHELQAQKELAGFVTQGRQLDFGSAIQDLVHEFTQLPQKLGGTLANVLFTHNRQESAGKQVGQAFRDELHQLVGSVFEQGIHKLLSSVLGNIFKNVGQTANTTALATNTSALLANTAVMTGNTAVTAAGTGATVAHTGIMATHLGVMVAHMGAMIANTVSTIANTIATIWNTVVQAVKSVFGFLGLAGGGELQVGRPTVVGEKGPEMIIPRNAGTVIPADKTQELLAASLFNVSPASSLSEHTNSLSVLKAYNSHQGTPTDYRAGGDTNIHLHGANFYGVTNTREMMRQMSDYGRNQKIRQSYNSNSK